MLSEQRIRAILFYLSLSIFLICLPFILSFALGYKFNTRTFKFTKTGLIALKTKPQGANIYLDGKLLNEKTPMTINELMPGKYNIRLELEDYYPWLGQVSVQAGKVARLERIIFFPLRPNIKQVNKDRISSFWVDEKNEKVYYVNQDEDAIYESDLEGENFKIIGFLPKIILPPKKWEVSPDKEKLLAFNLRQIIVVYLKSQEGNYYIDSPLVLDYSDRNILDVFWHPDSFHLILITNRNIEVIEAGPKPAAVNLVHLNKKNTSIQRRPGCAQAFF
jgi:hypothetical protein